MWLLYCLFAAFALVVFLIWRSYQQSPVMPPGPTPIPLLGNITKMNGSLREVINNLVPQYGPVVTLWFGSKPLIFVNDFALAVKALKTGDFASKPYADLGLMQGLLNRLPFESNSDDVVKKRAVMGLALNSDLLAKHMEDVCTQCLHELSASLELMCDRIEFDINPCVETVVHNFMQKLVYGVRCRLDMNKFVDAFSELSLMSLLLCKLFPPLKLFSTSYNRLENQYVDRELELKMGFYNMLNEVDSNEDIAVINLLMRGDFFQPALSKRDVESACADLFLSGRDGLAGALKWSILYFVTWPEIQNHVQVLLDERFGRPCKGKTISVNDSSSLSFLAAALSETLRLASVVPLLSCKAERDTMLKGFSVPKDTAVFFNVYSMHMDQRYWDDAHEFNPTRFLNAESSLIPVSKVNGFIPFGKGLRKCVAERLSLKFLSFVLANVLHKFHFEVSPWSPKPSMFGTAKLVLSPLPYHIKARVR